MKKYRTKNQFESAFKKFVHNFDETKIFFTHGRESHKASEILFVEGGKLKKFPMYKSEYYIHLDGWRFIEFIETGQFPMQSYVMLYDHSDINPADIGRIFEFEYIADKNERSNVFEMFHYTNKNVNDFLCNYRENYPACGLKHLPRPGSSTYKNEEF